MPRECFCGCGRQVRFARRRVSGFGSTVVARVDDLIAAREHLPDDYDPLLAELVAIGQALARTWQAVAHGTRQIRGADRILMENWLEDSSRMLAFAALSTERQAAIDDLILSGENRGELIDRLISGGPVTESTSLRGSTSPEPASSDVEIREERLEAACTKAINLASRFAASADSPTFGPAVTGPP